MNSILMIDAFDARMAENDDGLCDISELQISLDSLRPDENGKFRWKKSGI